MLSSELGLKSTEIEKIQMVFKNHSEIEKVIVYGSRAKGNYREGSDIDLTILGNLNYDELIQLKLEFEESNIPYLIDISIFNDLQSESLKEHINRVGKIFYNKTEK